MSNEVFADNSWYFRNALVRANYNNLQNNVHSTTIFLEQFMENLLTGAQHKLKNRYMHIDYSETAQSANSEISKCKNCTLEELALLREFLIIRILPRKLWLKQSANPSEQSNPERLNCRTKVCCAAKMERETVSGKCLLMCESFNYHMNAERFVMERRCSGIKKIIKEYKAQYKYSDDMQPEFVSEYGGFFLTLKILNHRLSENEKIKGEDKPKKREDIIRERMELVFEAISENPDITIKELSTLLNISKKQVETAINKLKDAKRIHRDGSDHDGKWIAN